MNYTLNAIISLSMGIPALLGWLRFKQLSRDFLPFLILLTLAFFNELLSILIINKGYNNAVNVNIFSLLEILLLLWQFKCWGLWANTPRVFKTWISLAVVCWLAEWYILQSGYVFFSVTIIVYAFFLTILAIQIFCIRLYTTTQTLYKDAIFVISIGLMIYFTYGVIMETLWLFKLSYDEKIYSYAMGILSVVNLFTNILYAFAILWIPVRREYIFPSSLPA